MGTFVYAAPEMLHRPQDAGPTVDVYGLGMTAIFALYGRDLPPAVFRDAAGFVAGLEAEEEVKTVLAKAVAWEVEGRWPSAKALCGAFEVALKPPEPPAPAPVKKRPSRSSSVGFLYPPRYVEPGQEKIHPQDGSVLVYVPGSEFTLGSENITDEETPIHRIRLSPYWIGKYPVTIAQYAKFLDAEPTAKEPAYWGEKNFGAPQQPVVGVSWLDAMAYCNWAGLELPTEAQWEAAARGTGALPYPWGKNEPHHDLANFDRNFDHPTPVGAYPEGAGPYGTLDQAGNVWEWCRDRWDPTAYKRREGKFDPWVEGQGKDEDSVRVLRGGGWANPARSLPSARRNGSQARDRDTDLGFRVLSGLGPEKEKTTRKSAAPSSSQRRSTVQSPQKKPPAAPALPKPKKLLQSSIWKLIADQNPESIEGARQIILAGERWRDSEPEIQDVRSSELHQDLAHLLTEVMQFRELPAPERHKAGLIASDLGDLPQDLDHFVPLPEEWFGYPFKIGKYPVTNAQYRRFMEDGGYDRDKGWISEKGRKAIGRRTQPRYWAARDRNRATQPVVGVTGYEAEAYCKWLTARMRASGEIGDDQIVRLPTFEEREKVAAGPEDRTFPWGDDEDVRFLNCEESKIGLASPVQMYPDGATPEGVWDLSGNVWEWTSSRNEAHKGTYILG